MRQFSIGDYNDYTQSIELGTEIQFDVMFFKNKLSFILNNQIVEYE